MSQWYTKKPIPVEVVRWDGSVGALIEIQGWNAAVIDDGAWLSIPTLEGTMKAPEGYYVIHGVRGEVYAVEPSIFEETYALANV